jgi:hypothetical protein
VLLLTIVPRARFGGSAGFSSSRGRGRLLRSEYRLAQTIVSDWVFEPTGFQLLDFLHLIKATKEKQVRDLLDYFERIGNSAGPKGIPDGIDLTADFPSEHFFYPIR